MQDSMPTLANAAVGYAQAGWKVLPTDPTTKRPRTHHGVLDATNDPVQVAEWWTAWPDAAVATPTGDGLLVIDIDPRNGGTLRDWMPKTRTARTQSGGLHLHYLVDEDLKSRAGLFGPGIDSKCKGGYVLIPPSPGYTWMAEGGRSAVTAVKRAYLEQFVSTESFPNGSTGGAARKHPRTWRKGMIHDQVIAWAGFLAQDSASEAELTRGVWALIEEARAYGCTIDNAGGHIDAAIKWVMHREQSKSYGPDLA